MIRAPRPRRPARAAGRAGPRGVAVSGEVVRPWLCAESPVPFAM